MIRPSNLIYKILSSYNILLKNFQQNTHMNSYEECTPDGWSLGIYCRLAKKQMPIFLKTKNYIGYLNIRLN